MTRLDELADLFRFNRWAEQRMFEATGKLSDEEMNRDLGNSFPSVRETLLHIVGAEWVWLSRWKGTSPTEYPRDKRDLTHPKFSPGGAVSIRIVMPGSRISLSRIWIECWNTPTLPAIISRFRFGRCCGTSSITRRIIAAKSRRCYANWGTSRFLLI